MPTYRYDTNSNAAPFFSDHGGGFINGDNPMAALRRVVATYAHPAGLFSAIISECDPENKTLTRYLSSRAATVKDAGCGMCQWKEDGGYYVNDVRAVVKPERFENLTNIPLKEAHDAGKEAQ